MKSIADMITETAAELDTEREIIAAAIAAKQIGENYWQRRHELERKVKVLTALKEAFDA